MKIICIDDNYSKPQRRKGINNKPVFFLKPESAILRAKLPFFIPEHSMRIIPRVNIVLKVCKLGKNIQKKFAHLYYDEIGIGIDMEAADTLERCKTKGEPWEAAKSYDFSSPIGSFISVKDFKDIKNISFSVFKNNVCVTKAKTAKMYFDFHDIIAFISEYMTIKTGDYIFTGSPPINEYVEINDLFECFIEDRKMLSFKVK